MSCRVDNCPDYSPRTYGYCREHQARVYQVGLRALGLHLRQATVPERAIEPDANAGLGAVLVVMLVGVVIAGCILELIR